MDMRYFVMLHTMMENQRILEEMQKKTMQYNDLSFPSKKSPRRQVRISLDETIYKESPRLIEKRRHYKPLPLPDTRRKGDKERLIATSRHTLVRNELFGIAASCGTLFILLLVSFLLGLYISA